MPTENTNKVDIYYTLGARRFDTLQEVLDFCSYIYTKINQPAPITFKTGTIGLRQFEKLLTYDLGSYVQSDRKNVVVHPPKKFIMEPYGEINIGYNKYLDHFFLEARRYQGLPISGGDIEFYIDDNAICTFKNNVDIQ
jgi:hypothetical protein